MGEHNPTVYVSSEVNKYSSPSEFLSTKGIQIEIILTVIFSYALRFGGSYSPSTIYKKEAWTAMPHLKKKVVGLPLNADVE